MIGNLNTRQMRHLERAKPMLCRNTRYEYCFTAHACGTAHETRIADWTLDGYSIKDTDDRQGCYQLVRWRRRIK